MQSAYFSYPRDFVGTTHQALASIGGERRPRGFSCYPWKSLGADRTSPEFTQSQCCGAPSGLGSSLAPAIRSHVAIPSRRETNRFLSFLRGAARRGGLPRLSLPSPTYPWLFIVPLRISALSAVLPIAPPPL